MVSVDALREPRKEFRVKELDDRHVEKLKNVLKNGYNQNYMLMAVHVDCNLADFNPNSEDYCLNSSIFTFKLHACYLSIVGVYIKPANAVFCFLIFKTQWTQNINLSIIGLLFTYM